MAVHWYRLAAEGGHPVAQFNLGVIYATGQGAPEDDAEAVFWLRKAAEQGHVVAQYNLGQMYANGDGVPEDRVEAYAWLVLSATLGMREAHVDVEYLTQVMTGPELEEARQLARELWDTISSSRNM